MNPSVRKDDTRFLDLLERWTRGEFTRADEQELLALTRTDDFRREAWEGLSGAPEEDHAERIAALRRRLTGQQPSGRGLVMPPWLAAAAAVLLLLVAVWVIRPWQKTDPHTPIAGTQPDQTPGTTTNTAPDNEQPPIAAAPDMPVQSSPNQGPYPPIASRQQESVAPENSVLDDAIAMQEMEENNTAIQEVVAQPAADKMADASPGSPATSAPAAPLPQETRKAKTKSEPARPTDSTRWFNTDERPDVAAMKKRDQEKSQPEPTGGWDAFAEYLRQSARLTPEARNNNISGTVRLQFIVDANGEPANIQILRGLGFGCDQEAIRLVKEWDWSPGSLPVTIDIRFVR
ncbi:MAG: TonB family protein [Saprospiraceae bacterium]|nr:TonB family protein [Saprospiraceae bacterium]